jgi:hypothetical protein
MENWQALGEIMALSLHCEDREVKHVPFHFTVFLRFSFLVSKTTLPQQVLFTRKVLTICPFWRALFH